MKTSDNEGAMYERLGAIVRVLHDSMHELGYDRSLAAVSVQIVDAQDRLDYVGILTEEAANKVLNAIDLSLPVQESLVAHSAELGARWTLQAEGKLSPPDFETLASDSRQFVQTVNEAAESEKARLLDIMMAQDFQDITGQLIKKITGIIKTVEIEMAQLLLDNAPPAVRASLSPSKLMDGPSLSTDAMRQDGVDDLLGSLGF